MWSVESLISAKMDFSSNRMISVSGVNGKTAIILLMTNIAARVNIQNVLLPWMDGNVPV